jgi:hypothetical protein
LAEITYYDGMQRHTQVDTLPIECPICHAKIRPIQTPAVHHGSNRVQVCFRCPDEGCDSIFIALYEAIPFVDLGYPEYALTSCVPTKPKQREHSTEIQEVSPSYVQIWNEAAAAEFHALKEIAGVGYRKALEFLIKDYLIRTGVPRPDVESKLLGKCINDHVQQSNIKRCAQRAAWLGNDETHYSRKWEELGLKELKDLIQMTVAWIELEERTDHFERQMPKGK